MNEQPAPKPSPVAHDLTPPETVLKQSLHRYQEEAKASGLRPGGQRRRLFGPIKPVTYQSGRDPVLIGEVLTTFLQQQGWAEEIKSGAVVGRWAELVGPNVAAHTAVLDFTDKVLTVQTDSTNWATELRMLTDHILGKIEKEVGPDVVTRIVIRGPDQRSFKRGLYSVPGRGPRDTYG